MAAKRNPKQQKQIELARAAWSESGGLVLDPDILFGRASSDDVAAYTPEMLAASADYAGRELLAWTGETARITVASVDGVAPNGTPVCILTVIDRDMPFLFDSVMGEITSSYRDISLAVHPILDVQPGKAPRLYSYERSQAAGEHVSLIQVHLAVLTEDQAHDLIARLRSVLDKVHAAISDWKPMLSLLKGASREMKEAPLSGQKAERDEALDFLKWLRDGNFIFLGMREYIYSGDGAGATLERGKGSGLGILSDPDVLVLRQGKDQVTTTPEILQFLQGQDFLIVTKANVKSVVHRRAYMDYVGVKRFDANGRVTGELRIVGLFTATAYTHSVTEIPLLRAKAAHIETHFGFDPQSHSGRMLRNTLESYPRDDLFQIDLELLARYCEQIMELAERPRVRALARIDHFDRFVSIIVYVPRENYNSIVREKIGAYLATTYQGHVSAYYPAFPEGGTARVHFIIGRRDGKTPSIPQAELEDAIREIATPWDERFVALAGAGVPALETSFAFQEAFSPEETVSDLPDILALAAGEPIRISLYERRVEERPILALKIFHAGEHLALSRRVPLLENLGFQVVSERTFDLDLVATGRRIVLHDMELQLPEEDRIDLKREASRIEQAFLMAFNGTIDNDSFNRLVLLTGLSAREVTVLRAYARYLRQTGIVYSQAHIADTLARYPDISRLIFALFRDGFDPGMTDSQREGVLSGHHAAIEEALTAVPNLDDDRTFRRFVNAIDSTLRTNYFQTDADGGPKAVLAFKFDPKLLEGLPQPRPFREIFVYGTEVEGVHLRFGKVARGGLRWSDRGEDYRTEVLGLVKAQQVKNAVIVPVGAKGGFFPKRLPSPAQRDAFFNAGKEAYKTFIRTLLSITDNIVGADVVGPADTLRLDGDDPYFVVAADKGTATFSDTANGLAQEAGFWLDDAFASGGSAGYDHKKMGITARGAWEAVKRHFREMDVDIQSTPFSVAGVGDMSGDVFGNGMLLSPHIRLIAAFDHRDIFIDPDPDTRLSFDERSRMFGLARSSWQDYDRSALSEGGMIIRRTEKSVALTPQAKAAIGIEADVATPFEIMTAILKSPVDLLWFGGIGTYIKAAAETDAEVGDRANDPIRVIAAEVRAKVIGEGANLGVTQKGRIAYALNGGRINSDAIDNSAGVNSSDVEVNIKIALSPAMRDGRLARDKRDLLLSSMTDEVARLVLRNNYLQTLAISLTTRRGQRNREDLSRLMSALETRGELNRKVETLPDDAELAERYAAGKPLTRPEVGVLLSYAKIVLFDAIVASALPDDPYFGDVLTGYFPRQMQQDYAGDIAHHRLHREIIATLLANEVINRGGPGFAQMLSDISGRGQVDVVKAAFIARDAYELPKLWAAVDALDGQLAGERQNALYERISEIFAGATIFILQTGLTGSDVAAAVSRIRAGLTALRGTIAPTAERAMDVSEAVPTALVEELNILPNLVLVPEIMLISERSGAPLERATEVYFRVTEAFRVNRFLEAGERFNAADHYENLAIIRSLQQIAAARRDIVTTALSHHAGDEKPLEAWLSSDRLRLNRISSELLALSEGAETTLAKMMVAASLFTDLAQSGAR
ncbi:NAD-glutamate dehydrogenase [Rhizobium sp. SSA_523]|uniref:NAD-glutamate dehydrogenase n=1 Tax=Rhizobium sp. SSA_523 TaxID=2952477 RepID=UPI00209167F5|nr:NAD-glutamate dehydrogenase [Rhizobium sp. SSA_523]MCO5734570.1 NAD-glutamate dehydrogenase [Rhizobium sp. SSA_523]WKC23351.1 NAD-glutamate dehydrogenase [Rhizobium sp. SSA_523]